jgi:uncharacterized protein (TIGR02001 family)
MGHAWLLLCTIPVRCPLPGAVQRPQVIDSGKLARIVLCSIQPGRFDPDQATYWEDTTMGRTRYLLAALGLAASPSVLAADLTANIGMMSDYIFRGVKQNTSAAAFGGLDYEHSSGLFVGTWAAEVGDGIEYDLYAGFAGELGDFSYLIGYTGYFYTDDFDDTYHELNLGLGYSFLSLEYSIGRYDNFDGPTLDYGFFAVTAEYEGLYGTWGMFHDDFDGDYFEVGYGTEVAGFDVSLAVIYSDSDLAPGDSSETSMMFTIGKTFDLR